jgi:CheY-like chemotaxis protein
MTDKQKLIMYVDDDEDDREILASAIKEANPEVDVVLAQNGLEALDCLASMKAANEKLPCLIVLDINMPFLDGRETYERLKQDIRFQQVPVIVFSSSEKPQDKALFNELGIEFFTKPSDISYMSRIVNHMISVCC